MVDQVIVDFATGSAYQSVSNWTSYNIQRDFFNPMDGFSLVCEDDRVDQLLANIQVGMRLNFLVNGSCILVGYVDTVELSYTRGGKGKSLMIQGRDICGQLMDAHLYPNLGLGGNTNYQFSPQTTLSDALNTILVNGLTPVTKLVNEDGTPFANSVAGSLTFATGFGVGIRAKGKTGRGISKSYISNLNRECKPEIGETYLQYALRLARHAGCFIKCIPGCDNTLFVGPPTYDRTKAPNYFVDHYLQQNNTSNNVHGGKMRISYLQQPSVIIGEATHGTATFRKQKFKVVCINELTGYQPGATTLNVANALPNVGNAVGQLTTGVAGNGQTTTVKVPSTPKVVSGPPATTFPTAEGGSVTTFPTVPTTKDQTIAPSGYYLIPPNYDLYNSLSNSIVGVQTNISRPYYYVDYNAQTPEELMIGVTERMADFQDKFLELEYVMDNHTDSVTGAIFAPNLMCSVTDQAYSPSNKSIAGTYWIQKVNFTKAAGGTGTETNIILRLPYTHMTNLTP